MTKKKIAVLAAFLIGINGFPMEAATVAAAGDGSAEGITGALEGFRRSEECREAGEGISGENETGGISFVSGNVPSVSGNMPVGNILAGMRAGMDTLRMPEETTVVIDPWEIDGRGQVYSERYGVRNEGNMAGTLVLSNLACFSKGQEKTVVKTDKEGIHNGREKSIYIELVFENGDRVAFGQDNSRYTVRLEPGEELVFQFAGEVNENAAGLWQDGDIAVSMDCSWGMEKTEPEADSEPGMNSEMESAAKTKAEPGMSSETEPGADSEPEVDSEMETVAEPETDSGNNRAAAGTEEGEEGGQNTDDGMEADPGAELWDDGYGIAF